MSHVRRAAGIHDRRVIWRHAWRAYCALWPLLALVMSASQSMAAERHAVAARTAAALVQYQSRCLDRVEPDKAAVLQSEVDELIKLGVETGKLEFRALFVAEFMATQLEIESVGRGSWCLLHEPVARVAYQIWTTSRR